MLGDSLAIGMGASDSSDAFVFRSVVDVFGDHLRSLTSYGMPGALVSDVNRLEVEQLSHTANVVIIVAGSDDLINGTAASAFADDYSLVLSAVDRSVPARILLCCGVPDAGMIMPLEGNNDLRAGLTGYYNDSIAILCKRHGGAYVRLDGLGLGAGSPASSAIEVAHASSHAYGMFASRLSEALRKARSLYDQRQRRRIVN